ncbi:MAG: flagellar basal body L-ring protein FlgH [Rhodospirillaceae bacterium]
MKGLQMRKLAAMAVLVTSAVALAGCGNTFQRLATVGEPPPITHVQNPTQAPGYRPVSLPMPAAVPYETNANSLWKSGARQFFKDQRAGKVGDLVTVSIQINESAKLSNTTTRQRTNSDNASLGSLFGFETKLNKIFPDAVDPTSLVDMKSGTNNSGSGTVDRGEKITLKVAAVITQALPNGNLVVVGRQELRVNFEVRELQIAGVVRPEDITSDNSISFEKIAEARVSYGGRGHISDFQQPRVGQQVFDIIMPF